MSTLHNPSNFEPRDYVVEDYLDNRRPEFFGQSAKVHEEEVRMWELGMQAVLGADWRAKAHRCIHCGNGNVRWITAVRHLPTNEVVVFGSDCTDRLGFANKVAFKLAQLQARAEARKVRFTIYNKRQEFLDARPELRAAAVACLDHPEHAHNHFAKDVISKLDQYGYLSDAQVSAVLASLKRDVEEHARRAVEAQEHKGPAPVGRVEVSGTVLSTKLQESDFGVSLKMLVKLENNAKVWCTVPSRETVERGDKITVKATWEASKDDPSFAFGKRPILVKRMAAEVRQ